MTPRVWKGERGVVCSAALRAPHRTYQYQMSPWGWLPARSLLIALNSNSLLLSFYSSLAFFSLSLSPALSLFLLSPLLPFPSPFPAVFWSTRVGLWGGGGGGEKFSTNCFGPERSPAVGPSLRLSLSPLFPLSLVLGLSSPCCDRAHLLDLGCTSSESNYPIGPRSHFSLIPPTRLDFLGVKLISNNFTLSWFFWEQVG